MPYELCPLQLHYYDPAKNKQCPFCPQAATQTIPIKETLPDSFNPPVGWLVVIEGPDSGKDFTLRAGNNPIGVLPAIPVAISSDASVSREEHAIIAYDTRSNQFLIRPGVGRALAWHNGAPVEAPTPLRLGDQITVGQTRLLFVPLVGENFRWA